MLIKFLSLRILPDSLTRYLLNILGIDFEGEEELGQSAFVSKYMNGCRGCFCVSVDFDNRDERRRDISSKATIELINLCEKFDIPMTWAICGKTVVNEGEAFTRIIDSEIGNELAIHTFDHTDFSDPMCDEKMARSQIIKTIQLLPPSSRPVTFVFPWNRYGHFDILREEGFIAYRGKNKKLGYPLKITNLWDIHPLFYISEKNFSYSGVLKSLVDLAIAYRAVCHIWFHPWNLEVGGDVSKFLSDTIKPLLEHVRSRRQDGKLWVCTLKDLANYCEARSSCSLICEPKSRSINVNADCEMLDNRFNKVQNLTLSVKIPNRVKISNIKMEDNKINESDAITIEEDHKRRILHINVIFDTPIKRLSIELSEL